MKARRSMPLSTPLSAADWRRLMRFKARYTYETLRQQRISNAEVERAMFARWLVQQGRLGEQGR